MDPKKIGLIQQHELQDIYRLQPGVILIVNKFKNKYHFGYSQKLSNDCKEKGMPGCYKLKESQTIEVYDNDIGRCVNKTFPEGTYLFQHYTVEPIDQLDISQYDVELKLAGGTFSGDIKSLIDLLNKIQNSATEVIRECMLKQEGKMMECMLKQEGEMKNAK
jgi:hypothetical protein